MSERAAALADAFEVLHAEVIRAATEASPEQWAAPMADEQWPAGFGFYHLADGYALVRDWIDQAVRGGAPTILDPAGNDARNGRQAAAHRTCAKDEVLGLLHDRGPRLAELVRGLTDQELGAGALIVPDGTTRDVEAVASGPMLNHVRTHLSSIKAATGLN